MIYSSPLPLAWMEAVIVPVLDALGLPRVNIIVFSFGGYWGLLFASAKPERVKRMVQLGCPALLPGFKIPISMRLLAIPSFSAFLAKMKPNVANCMAMFYRDA
jgi:pimeloyl-ACP methyl ester carboxylesterase